MEGMESPILSAIATLITLITTYVAKFKKYVSMVTKVHLHVYGDEDKKGSATRLRELEATVDNLKTKIEHAIGQNPLEGLDAEAVLQIQATVKDALKPIWLDLERKVNKEILDLQIKHIMEAIARIGGEH